MNNFRVGQKVVCVDVPWPEHAYLCASMGTKFPVAGQVYTIRWIGKATQDGRFYVRLEEIVNPILHFPGWLPGEPRFGVRRFRPIVSHGTEKGMSILRELLNKTDKPARVEA